MTKHVVHHKSHHAAHKPTLADLTVEFQTKEFSHHDKNELWYLGIGLLVLVGAMVAIGVSNYLLVAVAIAAGLAIFRISREKPGQHQVVINPEGIQWGGQHFAYHHFKSFWTADQDGAVAIYLERPNWQPTIHFTVPDDAVEKALTFLSIELPFHYHKDEPLSDRLGRVLKI